MRVYEYPVENKYDEETFSDFLELMEIVGIAEVNVKTIISLVDRVFIISRVVGARPSRTWYECGDIALMFLGLKTDIRPKSDSEFVSTVISVTL